MNKLLILVIASAMLLSACEKQPAPPAPKTITITKSIAVSGFDPVGEPELREMSDGTLVVTFKNMPPSFDSTDEKKYANFDKQLEKAVGVQVIRDDTKFFTIRKPEKDTAEKAKAFLEGYRKAAETQPAQEK